MSTSSMNVAPQTATSVHQFFSGRALTRAEP